VQSDVDSLVDGARKMCIEENMNTEEECDSVFGRFLAKLAAETAGTA
jgi:hypothetical protein